MHSIADCVDPLAHPPEAINPNAAVRELPFPVEWLEFGDSKKRMDAVLERMKNDSQNQNLTGNHAQRVMASIMKLLFFCHACLTERMNTRSLNSMVPWDARTKLPSHPTLIADAEVFMKVFQNRHAGVETVIKSFSARQEFARQKIDCACDGSWKTKEIGVAIFVANGLTVRDERLHLISRVEVESDNAGHPNNHYSYSSDGSAPGSRCIVLCEAKVSRVDDPRPLEISVVREERAKEFQFDLFANDIQNDINSFLHLENGNSREGKGGKRT